MPIYFTALLITIAVEYLVYLAMLRQKPFQLLTYSIIINCLTQPLAYYVYFYLIPAGLTNNSLNLYFIIVEILVFLIESFLLQLLLRVIYTKALLISFIANIITALLSFVL